MLNRYLSYDKDVYIEDPNPHRDWFPIYKEDQIILVSKNDAYALIDELTLWLNETNFYE